MWLWSKGLGRLILPMNIEEAELCAGGENLVVEGVIIAPKVHWDYDLTLSQQDLVDLMSLMRHRQVLQYLARESGFRFLAILLAMAIKFTFAYMMEVLTPRKVRQKVERPGDGAPSLDTTDNARGRREPSSTASDPAVAADKPAYL